MKDLNNAAPLSRAYDIFPLILNDRFTSMSKRIFVSLNDGSSLHNAICRYTTIVGTLVKYARPLYMYMKV
jgi:hypothetical protein